MSTSAGGTTLLVHGLPPDVTAREFSVVFRFAQGFVSSKLGAINGTTRSGYVKFDRPENAMRVCQLANNKPFCAQHSQNIVTMQITPVDIDDPSLQIAAASRGPAAVVPGAPGGGLYGAVDPSLAYGQNALLLQQQAAMRAAMMAGGGGGVGGAVMSRRPEDCKSVYVAGIPPTMTEHSLFALFSPFGSIQRLDGPKTGQVGKPGNFAFIHYSSPQEAQQAIQGMGGHQVEGGATLLVRLQAVKSYH
eukprot:PhF_6_TR41651/c0_g1_i1/m.63143